MVLNDDLDLSPKPTKNLTTKHSKKHYLSPNKKSEAYGSSKQQFQSAVSGANL